MQGETVKFKKCYKNSPIV